MSIRNFPESLSQIILVGIILVGRLGERPVGWAPTTQQMLYYQCHTRDTGCAASLTQRALQTWRAQRGQSPYSHEFQRVWLKRNLDSKGWNSQAHRGFPGTFESSNLRRDNVSREIGRMHDTSATHNNHDGMTVASNIPIATRAPWWYFTSQQQPKARTHRSKQATRNLWESIKAEIRIRKFLRVNLSTTNPSTDASLETNPFSGRARWCCANRMTGRSIDAWDGFIKGEEG